MAGPAVRKPWSDRTDIEKLESQWKKVRSLRGKNQASAAVVRAATAAEIAANIAIRSEFARQSGLDKKTVDSFLLWANGLNGKMTHLVFPLVFNNVTGDAKYVELLVLAKNINQVRNRIVHSGVYASGAQLTSVCTDTKRFVEALLNKYHPGYELPAIEDEAESDASESDTSED